MSDPYFPSLKDIMTAEHTLQRHSGPDTPHEKQKSIR